MCLLIHTCTRMVQCHACFLSAVFVLHACDTHALFKLWVICTMDIHDNRCFAKKLDLCTYVVLLGLMVGNQAGRQNKT